MVYWFMGCDYMGSISFNYPALLHMLTFSVMVSVSLKAKLSPSELSKLIMDVRRRVEMNGAESKLGERWVI